MHIQLDEVRSLIVAGLADPQAGGSLAGRQYAVSVQACIALAPAFLADGYDVAVDDVMQPDAFEAYWRPVLADLAFRLIVVLPELEETLQRSAVREKRVRPDLTRQQHAASLNWPQELRLDTTRLDIASSLEAARGMALIP